MADTTFHLYYWPSIQGRGEFVRLALEDADAPYVDVARQPGKKGVPAMMKILHDGGDGLAPFAPPFLEVDGLVIAQVANILLYLGPRLGLVPTDEPSRLAAHQLQLTVTDWVAEVHDTHHPIASGLYYEDQKPEALRRATDFVNERLPKYLGYFERALARGGGKHFVGGVHTYVDLSLFQMMAGLDYAFPKAMAHFAPQHPHLVALAKRVAARPRIAAYLASGRRLAFSVEGIFRRYPELDVEPAAHRGRQ